MRWFLLLIAAAGAWLATGLVMLALCFVVWRPAPIPPPGGGIRGGSAHTMVVVR